MVVSPLAASLRPASRVAVDCSEMALVEPELLPERDSSLTDDSPRRPSSAVEGPSQFLTARTAPSSSSPLSLPPSWRETGEICGFAMASPKLSQTDVPASATAGADKLAKVRPFHYSARTVEEFELLEMIGEGTYGQVFMARETATNEIVALKRVLMDQEREGFPVTAIREIKLLRALRHPAVVELREIVIGPHSSSAALTSSHAANSLSKSALKAPPTGPGWVDRDSVYLVFEYIEHDLAGLAVDSPQKLTEPLVKSYLLQLLSGLAYCHREGYLHRDIKLSNILVSNDGQLKIADFGLGRKTMEDWLLTNKVITLWYRPPELLLGAMRYSTPVDVWSVGCILFELLTKKPLFDAADEFAALKKIFMVMGPPIEDPEDIGIPKPLPPELESCVWPGVSDLPLWKSMRPKMIPGSCLRQFLQTSGYAKILSPQAADLLEKMLMLDPNRRISAEDALRHPYFSTAPLPLCPGSQEARGLLSGLSVSSHILQTKRRKKESSAVGAAGTAAATAASAAGTSSAQGLRGAAVPSREPVSGVPDRASGTSSHPTFVPSIFDKLRVASVPSNHSKIRARP